MNNLRSRFFKQKTIILTVAALAFVLNIAVSSQLDSNYNSLNGVVLSAFADDETVHYFPSDPADCMSIEPDTEDNLKSVDEDQESMVSYIINLFE